MKRSKLCRGSAWLSGPLHDNAPHVSAFATAQRDVLYVPINQFAGNVAAQGFPAPVLLAYLTYFTELVAAACLALGLFTRVAALMIWIEMAVIITKFNWKFGYFWTNRGIEYALLLWLLCTAIFFRGGGRYSLDRLIGKEF